MGFRLRAFALHLLISALALTLVLGGFYLGWYRWPGWYLSGVLIVVLVMCGVDLALGPTLTLIVANPRKPRRVLARDIAVIAAAQLAALIYGSVTLWMGRPLYYAYWNQSLDLVQASDLEADEVSRALKENPAFAPHWYSGVRWVWAPMPADPGSDPKLTRVTANGARDVSDMPRYYRRWDEGLPQLQKNLQRVAEIPAYTKSERAWLAEHMSARGILPAQANAMVMWGEQGTRPLLTVFDPQSLQVRAMLPVPTVSLLR